jgi:CRP-like cAMP-binding protein
MIENLIDKFGSFTHYDKQLFKQALVQKKIVKNDFLLRVGEVCQSSFLIITGAFIQYNFKDEIDQNIIDLHLENEWVLNQQSFVRQQPSETFIQAFTDSVVYELTVQKMHELIGKSPAFFQLGKILEPVHSRVHLFDNQLTPTEKYQFVLQSRVALLQTFPLKIIASYLKITPETLSRVREKISRE